MEENKIRFDTEKVKRSVPQGSLLGPLRFLIFTTDLPAYLKSYCHPVI